MWKSFSKGWIAIFLFLINSLHFLLLLAAKSSSPLAAVFSSKTQCTLTTKLTTCRSISQLQGQAFPSGVGGDQKTKREVNIGFAFFRWRQTGLWMNVVLWLLYTNIVFHLLFSYRNITCKCIHRLLSSSTYTLSVISEHKSKKVSCVEPEVTTGSSQSFFTKPHPGNRKSTTAKFSLIKQAKHWNVPNSDTPHYYHHISLWRRLEEWSV